MPPEEELDVVEPDGTWIGRRSRREVHEQGLWHQVFHCLVVRTGTPRVVLQQRHRDVRSFAGKLDLSASGHLSAGETPLEGVRELIEELGIDVDPGRLIPLGARLLVDDGGGEGRNRERVHVFLLPDDRPLEAFAPDPDDVEALVEIDTSDLLAIVADPSTTVTATRWAPGSEPATVAVTGADLVPAVDGYWTVLAVMAERHTRGERPLAI